MRIIHIVGSAILAGSLLASPAMAQSVAVVPEPNNLLLLGLGVVGLIIGRQAARRKPRD